MAAPQPGEVWLFEHGKFGGKKLSVTSNVPSLKVLVCVTESLDTASDRF